MRRLPDPELIALARTGSAEAAGVLFDRYWDHAWRAAYAVTADRALADDAAQDAVQRAFGALDRFDETRAFGPWLKRIAANRAVDLLRRERRLTALDEHAVAYEWDAAGGDRAVAEAVGALDPQKRIIVVLRYWLDLSVEEIAGVLGIPVGTVASRLSRALARLRVALEEEHVA
ncbi:MAG TPA: sigma-70 family RNA polymerase sigma factor [Gaiellaceae bacterium]|nr:sigma-70 family RNA polymerase sigma factor [Gaiellaceae bacterium]